MTISNMNTQCVLPAGGQGSQGVGDMLSPTHYLSASLLHPTGVFWQQRSRWGTVEEMEVGGVDSPSASVS